jgi:hypothetical protein
MQLAVWRQHPVVAAALAFAGIYGPLVAYFFKKELPAALLHGRQLGMVALKIIG